VRVASQESNLIENPPQKDDLLAVNLPRFLKNDNPPSKAGQLTANK
jgi:hypothetical protein